MKVSEVMNKAATIDKDVKLIDIAKVFSKESINSVIFIKDGEAEGIITERDIIKNIEKIRKKSVCDVMSKNLVSIDYDKSIEDAAELMAKKKVKRLLVTDEKNELIGIIGATDVIAHSEDINRVFSFFD